MQRQCSGTTKTGERCKSWAALDSEFCIAHDPNRVIELAEYRKRGGEGRSNTKRARKAIAADLRDLGSVQATMKGVLQKLEDGDMEPAVATAMATVANSLVKIASVNAAVNFEQQLSDMQRQIAALSERRQA